VLPAYLRCVEVLHPWTICLQHSSGNETVDSNENFRLPSFRAEHSEAVSKAWNPAQEGGEAPYYYSGQQVVYFYGTKIELPSFRAEHSEAVSKAWNPAQEGGEAPYYYSGQQVVYFYGTKIELPSFRAEHSEAVSKAWNPAQEGGEAAPNKINTVTHKPNSKDKKTPKRHPEMHSKRNGLRRNTGFESSVCRDLHVLIIKLCYQSKKK
jgi:hypothetical protein